MHYRIFLYLIIFLATCLNNCYAADSYQNRFASTKSNEINMRAGPSARYPISWVYIKKGEPLEILAEYEHWQKIRDFAGDEGWIRGSMLSSKRYGIVTSNKNLYLYKKADFNSQPIAVIEPEARVALVKCKQHWCQIQVEDHKGWLARKSLWGVVEDEEF